MKQRSPYRCIDIHAAAQLVRQSDTLLLDARHPDAFRRDHIVGARRISITNLSELVNATARNRPILIYCHHGHASREYAKVFSDFGFTEVYSLDGGYEAWKMRVRDTRSSTVFVGASSVSG